MEYNHFEDTGTFYANQDMVQKNIVLSMNTGLVYDMDDASNVKVIKRVSFTFFAIAEKDIANDGAWFYGQASIFQDDGTLIWKY